jgi:2-phospho-L-lactate guanylyltransferase (CobY/MobA/RfbA family)
VINADVPCVVPHDLRTLAGAAELGALGYVEAEDGTTNALGLPEPAHFAPLYGGGSAARFRDHAEELGLTAISCAIPNLSDDVDTMDDLRRIGLRAGPRTLDGSLVPCSAVKVVSSPVASAALGSPAASSRLSRARA